MSRKYPPEQPSGRLGTRKLRLIGMGVFPEREPETEHLIFIPQHYEPGYAYPLLVWLHGPGSDEEQLLRIMPLVSLRNYLAVAPRGLRQITDRGQAIYSWPQTPEGIDYAQAAVAHAIRTVCSRYHVAEDRIFLAGFDLGGTMALRLALEEPWRFAGAASLGGAFPTWGRPFALLRQQRQLSFLLLSGAYSERFSPEEACRALKLLHQAGISVILRQYSCGDQMHQGMLADLNRWIMGQVTGQNPFDGSTSPCGQVGKPILRRPAEG